MFVTIKIGTKKPRYRTFYIDRFIIIKFYNIRNEILWKFDVLASDIKVFDRNIPESIKYLERAIKRIPDQLQDIVFYLIIENSIRM